MGSPGEQIDRIEALRSLMDRLCAPDLTLGEAKAMRPNLDVLLGTGLPGGESSRMAVPRNRPAAGPH